jgi:hypothetical protein
MGRFFNTQALDEDALDERGSTVKGKRLVYAGSSEARGGSVCFATPSSGATTY